MLSRFPFFGSLTNYFINLIVKNNTYPQLGRAEVLHGVAAFLRSESHTIKFSVSSISLLYHLELSFFYGLFSSLVEFSSLLLKN